MTYIINLAYMNTLKGIIPIALFLIATLFIGCQRDEIIPNTNNNTPDQLPPITTTGENTFGCKVDGVVWVPNVPPGNIPIYADYSNGVCYVNGRKLKYNSDYTTVILSQSVGFNIFTGFTTTDTIKLTHPHTWPSTSFDKARGFYYDWVPGNCELVTDSLHEGYLKIIYMDTINQILSGVFEYSAWSPACNRVVNITEGRFDVHY